MGSVLAPWFYLTVAHQLLDGDTPMIDLQHQVIAHASTIKKPGFAEEAGLFLDKSVWFS